MREGTFNTTQSTLLRRKCPEAYLTPSQDLSMWTAFDLVYVPLGNQSSQFWESLLLGYPVWIPKSTGKKAAKARIHWIFFFWIVRVSFALGLFGDQIQTPVTQSVFRHKISKIPEILKI